MSDMPDLPLELTREIQKKFVGPTPYSNWLIPKKVLVGGYPGIDGRKIKTREEQLRMLNDILSLGIDHFVCLQAEIDETCKNVIHENDYYGNFNLSLGEFIGYLDDIENIVEMNNICDENGQKKDIKWTHFSIKDGKVREDQDVIELIDSLKEEVLENKKLYIHCAGGHGRTGTIAGCLIGALYDYSPEEVLKRVSLYHKQRSKRVYKGSPTKVNQIDQVKRIVTYYNNQNNYSNQNNNNSND
eukprot:TRINITY_DN2919_c4_g1_i1.p1 TRINITY_DN2919_c4_g1~~TRINITY_DN2919_c4_g1_i1.p1  ORF type:complete len:243 (-),score=69.06 TRINITY_DN2919_c4_g1_i1:98-826(-)